MAVNQREGEIMKVAVSDARYGEIEYEESFWIGKKSIAINGTPLEKLAKNRYRYNGEDGPQDIVVQGSYLMGVKLLMPGRSIRLTAAITWYETALSVLIFMLILIWGNTAALCGIVPVVGGMLGGVISAAFAFANALIIKAVRPIWLKIAVTVCVAGVCFLICWGLALAVTGVAGAIA